PGEPLAASLHDEIRRVCEGRPGPVVVVVGRGNLAAAADSVVGAAAELARVHDVRFLSALRRGNVHGALDAGLAPGFLPGRTTLDAGRAWFTERWGGVPAERGLAAEGILRAAAGGTAMDDWRIAAELALRLGRDLDLATVDEVTDEIARVAPAFAGVTSELVKLARNGVVVPMAAHLDEPVLRTGDLSIMADDGSGTSWDPIKVEGVAPAELDDAPEVSVPV